MEHSIYTTNERYGELHYKINPRVTIIIFIKLSDNLSDNDFQRKEFGDLFNTDILPIPHQNKISANKLVLNLNTYFAIYVCFGRNQTSNNDIIKFLDISVKNPKFAELKISKLSNWQFLENIVTKHHFKTLILHETEIINNDAYENLSSLNNVDNLCIDNCIITAVGFQKYLDVAKNVESLSICNFECDDYTLQIIQFVKDAKIQSLNLACKIQEKNLIEIIKAIHDNKYIQEIYLNDKITNNVLKAFDELLDVNNNIININNILNINIDEQLTYSIIEKLEKNKQSFYSQTTKQTYQEKNKQQYK